MCVLCWRVLGRLLGFGRADGGAWGKEERGDEFAPECEI